MIVLLLCILVFIEAGFTCAIKAEIKEGGKNKKEIAIYAIVALVVGIIVFALGESETAGIGILFSIGGLAIGLFMLTPKESAEYNKKSKVSRAVYDQMQLYSECNALLTNKDKFMGMLKDDSEYFALEEIYKHFPDIYKKYTSEMLNKPMVLTRPISPYTAAMLGTQIGGFAGGVVAAQMAYEKKEAYEKNQIDTIVSRIKVGNSLEKLTYCHASILAIITRNEEAKLAWRAEVDKIDAKMKEQYIV